MNDPKIAFSYPKIKEHLLDYDGKANYGIIFLDNVNTKAIRIEFWVETFAIDLLPDKDYAISVKIETKKVNTTHFSKIITPEKSIFVNKNRTLSHKIGFSIPDSPSDRCKITTNLIEVQPKKSEEEKDGSYSGLLIDESISYFVFARYGDVNE